MFPARHPVVQSVTSVGGRGVCGRPGPEAQEKKRA